MKFDRYAKGYDAGWQGTKSARFYDDLIKQLDIQPNDAVLDVGCGTGTVLHFIASQTPIRGYGLDISAEMLDVARKKNPGFDFRLGDSKKLPYADSSMDVIMACMAYHHFADQKGFREEARRVLKPNGWLYICDPRFPWLVRTVLNTCFREAGFHATRRNAADFTESGFQVERIAKDLYVQVAVLQRNR